MLKQETLKFISNLKENNHRDWFQANRPAYESAKVDFAELVVGILLELAKTDPSLKGISAKECMFRINKDVRFSKDKSPYKTNFGAGISKAGRKLPVAGYYLHCEPGQSFVAGGIYMPEPELLKVIREEIAYDSEELKSIMMKPSFKKYFASFDMFDKLVNVPKGYDKSHPDAELLKLKSFIVSHPLKDSDFTNAKAISSISGILAEITPLVNHLNRLLGK